MVRERLKRLCLRRTWKRRATTMRILQFAREDTAEGEPKEEDSRDAEVMAIDQPEEDPTATWEGLVVAEGRMDQQTQQRRQPPSTMAEHWKFKPRRPYACVHCRQSGLRPVEFKFKRPLLHRAPYPEFWIVE
jgi:hypothetical protein